MIERSEEPSDPGARARCWRTRAETMLSIAAAVHDVSAKASLAAQARHWASMADDADQGAIDFSGRDEPNSSV